MTIKADSISFVSEEYLETLSDQQARELATLFGSESVKLFIQANKEAAWKNMVGMDPIAMGNPQDYFDTMVHLRNVANLWDALQQFAARSQEALMDAAKKQI